MTAPRIAILAGAGAALWLVLFALLGLFGCAP